MERHHEPTVAFQSNDHLEVLSEHGDPLVVMERTVDFEYFRSWLVEGLGYGVGSNGATIAHSSSLKALG